jgi:hypothetical protein
MLRFLLDAWVGWQILIQGLTDAGIDDDFVALLAFFFADGEAISVVALGINKIADAQWKEVGDQGDCVLALSDPL